ncbi:unnamed protein product [Adineta steineri]|nr:unnamed protein product [Adineta steineri]CAF4107885.1 unnamed protein product [Adineta steineri]
MGCQGYDGANVMSGKNSGVRKLIKDISSRAIYLKHFFGVVKAIITFINDSPKRKTMLAKAIESTNNETKRRHLVKLCETR